jgi:hypothetical protein
LGGHTVTHLPFWACLILVSAAPLLNLPSKRREAADALGRGLQDLPGREFRRGLVVDVRPREARGLHALVVGGNELGRAGVLREGRMVFEPRERGQAACLRVRHGRPRRGKQMELARGLVVDALHGIEQLRRLQADRAGPQQVRRGILDPRGNAAEVARSEFVLERQHGLQAPLGRDLLPALGQVERRGKLAGDEGDGLRRRGGARVGVEQHLGIGQTRLRPQRECRELHLVGRQARVAEAALDEQLVEALRHAHRRDDRAGAVRSHQQVDLFARDEALVQGARVARLRLVVQQHELHLAAQQSAALVQRIDEDLGRNLVDGAHGRQGSGERQRAAHPDRLCATSTLRLRRQPVGQHQCAGRGKKGSALSLKSGDAHRCLLEFRKTGWTAPAGRAAAVVSGIRPRARWREHP